MEVTAEKTKKEMKDVFGKADSLIYDSHVLDILSAKTSTAAVTLAPEIDVPVLLDSLTVSQDDPDLTHVKIIGLSGDWYMDAEPGDSSVEFTVPTKSKDILVMAFGSDAVGEYFVKVGDSTYKGTGFALKMKKITGTFAILNKEKDQLLIISGAEVFATALYGDDNTVYAIKFTGAITSDGEAPNFLWLKDADKQTA